MIYRDIDADGQRRPGYVQISNAILADERLSAIDIVILARLLAKRDGWNANKTQMADENKINKETATTHIRRLAQFGYLRPRNADRDIGSGRYIAVEYDVVENPTTVTDFPSRPSDHDGFSVTVQPSRSNRDGKSAPNNNILNKTKNNKTIQQQQQDGVVADGSPEYTDDYTDEQLNVIDRLAQYRIVSIKDWLRDILINDQERVMRNIDYVTKVEQPPSQQIAGAIINAIREDRARIAAESDARRIAKRKETAKKYEERCYEDEEGRPFIREV